MYQGQKIVVFSDLDATLLDSRSYSWEPAREAVEALREIRASLVLVSSKTFSEMESLFECLGFDDPFIVENGGGIALPPSSPVDLASAGFPHATQQLRKGRFLVVPLGELYETMVRELNQISEEIGICLQGFSSMTPEKVSELTGLTLQDAIKAKDRHFDEPFLVPNITDKDIDNIKTAARKRGLTAVQGGRFWHLIGHDGKGHAAALLIEAYRCVYGEILSVGLGDAPNDFPFLELMDLAVIVGGLSSGLSLPKSLSKALKTEDVGPAGWNSALCTILSQRDRRSYSTRKDEKRGL